MQFEDILNNKDISPFEFHTVERPWGGYTNYADNKHCTVKILWVKKGESLSKQFHFKRDQLYVLLDDGFKITDGENVIENAKKRMTFGFPKGHIHRAEYFGDKEYGMILDLAWGENDEEDIVRCEDKFSRGNGKSVEVHGY